MEDMVGSKLGSTKRGRIEQIRGDALSSSD